MGGTNRSRLRKARQLAPSHCFGVTWTPADRRLNEIPFFVDNGAFTSSFDPDEWVGLLDKLEDYNYGPDFVVLPDEYNDAEGTMARHREWAPEVLDRGLPPAAVIQPGMPVETQVGLADKIGADFVFVGGETRWKRAHGYEIVDEAHARDMAVHIGRRTARTGCRGPTRSAPTARTRRRLTRTATGTTSKGWRVPRKTIQVGGLLKNAVDR